MGVLTGKRIGTEITDALKVEVNRKANELIDTILTERYIRPPISRVYNYVIKLSTKWHGRYFYLIATYACQGPNAIAPTFDVNFARLEYQATNQFNLAYMRHTER